MRVHLGMAGRAVAVGTMHLFENGRRRAQSQTGAAELLGDQGGKEARLRHCSDEIGGIGALTVQSAPVLAGKARAQLAHRLANFRKVIVFRFVHRPTAAMGVTFAAYIV